MAARDVQVLLLDVNLPDGNGLTLARRLRSQAGLDIGIIVLTCRGTVADRVTGLDSGADAYLVKDADLLEIDATIRSVLRRLPQAPASAAPPVAAGSADPGPAPTGPASSDGAWTLTSASPVLQTPGGARVVLTVSEHAFLLTLLDRRGEPMTREQIAAGMERLPGWSLRNLDSLVRRLRSKIREVCGETLPLRMAYGRGYSLEGQWRC
ncbi:response regulator transcription factor [Azospirillum sp.]|uniref:response regulator transcription factor n=1 Tax=Azospirillum sp. TaxID=34012 RepID=UPI003D71CC74